MADIFLSYAKVDRSKVEPIVALLEEHGWQVWWDKRIGGGEQWDEVVERELNSAKCVVVVWSPESVSSRWVRSEASVAAERNALVPVSIGNAAPPLAFRLIQITDLSGWDGSSSAADARALLSAVRSKIDLSRVPPPLAPTLRSSHFTDFKPERLGGPSRAASKSRISLWLFAALLCVLALTIAASYPLLSAWFKGERVYSHGEKIQDCSTCPAMIAVAGSPFAMGRDEGESTKTENPIHQVSLKGILGVGRFEVTNREYVVFLNAMLRNGQYDEGWVLTDRNDTTTPLLFRLRSILITPGYENHPVGGVSFRGARAYVAWLSSETGRRYRLPTEAEWEHAARAGTTSQYFFGDDVLKLCEYGNIPDSARLQKHRNWVVVNCTDGYSESAPVGRFGANAFGLHDILGNIWEWVEDCWHEDYKGAPNDGSAWVAGGDCSKRVIRGGSFDNFPIAATTARYRNSPNDRFMSIGFRVVRQLD